MSVIDGAPVPAGWYPDPHRRAEMRWWDGSSWTDAEHNPFPQTPTLSPAPTPAAHQSSGGYPAATQANQATQTTQTTQTEQSPYRSAVATENGHHATAIHAGAAAQQQPEQAPARLAETESTTHAAEPAYPTRAAARAAEAAREAERLAQLPAHPVAPAQFPSLGAMEETVPMPRDQRSFEEILASTPRFSSTQPIAETTTASATPPPATSHLAAVGAPDVLLAPAQEPSADIAATPPPVAGAPVPAASDTPSTVPASPLTGPILSAPKLAELPPPIPDDDEGYTWDREVLREDRAGLLAPTVSAAASTAQFFSPYRDPPTRRATLSAYLLALSPLVLAGAVMGMPFVLEAYPGVIPSGAPWWMPIAVVGGLLYFLGIMVAIADRASLVRADHDAPAGVGWAALTVPAYLLVRTIAVKRETSRLSSPLFVWLVCAVLVGAGTYYLMITEPGYLSSLAAIWLP